VSTYYSRGMAAPQPPASRRPRRGSLDRPVNARLYRGAWLIVAFPLLIAALTVSRPSPLPAPALPPAFDGLAARELARELATLHPNRFPGTPGATQAAAWVSAKLRTAGLRVQQDQFSREIPGYGRVLLQNLSADLPGPPGSQTIVVAAHRDNAGTGSGANDNASGTAALVELARAFAQVRNRSHTLRFLSTDGGSFGALGAAHFAAASAGRDRIVAAIDLDALAGRGAARLELAGDRPRSPSPTLVRTAAARLLEQTGSEPGHASGAAQLIDLALPFSLYEQAPFVARGIPALTITTAGARPPSSAEDSIRALNGRRLAALGRAAYDLIASLDQGLELAQGTSSYVYLGSRVVRGWAIELVLIAALLPFLVATVDLYARCRRRRIALGPALRSLRSRLALWAWVGLLFVLLDAVGAWPEGAARPPAPGSAAAGDWAVIGLAVLAGGGFAGWLAARERLLPRRTISGGEQLAGHTAALLALAVVALLVTATNPFALVFLLPSLHAWLWLPHVHRSPTWTRLAVFAVGFAGPAFLLLSFAGRFALGFDAPWYLLSLVALGYVPPPLPLICLGWLAVAGQLAALAGGRYAPYPSVGQRPPRGPFRAVVHTLLLRAGAHPRAVREREQAQRASEA
jgi:peptidase M28-like protein